MKIAFLTTDNREHSKDYSHKVPYFGTAMTALLEGFSLFPEVEVHVISVSRLPMVSPAKLAPNIYFHSVIVKKIGWMSTAYQGCVRAVRRKLKEIKPNIVHGQGTERDCAVEAVFSGLPNVITIHGNMRLIAQVNHAKAFSYLWLNGHLERLTLPLSDGIICITNYTKKAVNDIARKTWLLPNAVDSRFFFVIRNKPVGDPPRLLVIAHISYRKNQNAFIRALDGLAREFKFEVVFLGAASFEDPYGSEFHELISERPWCKWYGFEDRVSLLSRMTSADAVVLPSLEDNCPMAVLEGMAAGVPVLAGNVGGVPDLVTHGANGTLFDPTDPKSMEGAVREFLEHPQDAFAMAATAKVQALERFHPKSIAEKHLEIYREVLGWGGSVFQEPALAD